MASPKREDASEGTARCSPYWPTAASRVVATIGYPVSHSMSPLLHQAAFDALGLDWVSVAFAVLAGTGTRRALCDARSSDRRHVGDDAAQG